MGGDSKETCKKRISYSDEYEENKWLESVWGRMLLQTEGLGRPFQCDDI